MARSKKSNTTRKEGCNLTIEDLTVIVANQNYFIRNGLCGLVEIIQALAKTVLNVVTVLTLVALVAAISLSCNQPTIAIIGAIIGLIMLFIVIGHPIDISNGIKDNLEDLDQKCVDLETSRLAGNHDQNDDMEEHTD